MLILRASGQEQENMRRVVLDLKDYQGKEIFIRLVDKHSGGWGHVNFDDFRFHSEKTERPAPADQAACRADIYKYAGLPPEEGRRRR